VSTASWKSRFSPLRKFWSCDEAQGIAEYAIMLAAILLIVTGVLRLLGATTNDVFTTVARIFSPNRD
jgi:Flp pilus assembly pilin Flp